MKIQHFRRKYGLKIRVAYKELMHVSHLIQDLINHFIQPNQIFLYF